MGLSKEQRQNAKIIVRVGRRMKASRKQIKAALAAGQVESNLINTPGGDRDSVGVFQIRSGIHGPIGGSVVKSAQWFFKNAKSADKGQSSGQLAQDVERSAYPDKYGKPDIQRTAGELLRANKGGGGGGGRGGGGGGKGGSGGGGGGLQQQAVQRLETIDIPPPTVTPPRQPIAPIVSANIAGVSLDPRAQAVQSFQPPAPAPVEQAPQQLDVLRQKLVTVKPPKQSGGGGGGKGGRGGGGGARSGRASVNDAPPAGTKKGQPVLKAFGKWAQGLGANVSEGPGFGKVHPVHVPNSEHYSGRALDIGVGSKALGDRIARKARRRGYDVLWQVANHYDHVHISLPGSGS